MIVYNFQILRKEISEFIEWYYPFIWKKKISEFDKQNFYKVWEKTYKAINLNSNSFVHKDFFCNNLIYMPSRKYHLQCGIIDYQDAFWGDKAFDLVSLFEDSRRIINNNYQENLLNYYLNKTNQYRNKDEFLARYNFIGVSRQTRILGRWFKLFNINKQPEYLKYINFTWYWLEKNLNHPLLMELKKIYIELIPLNKRKYEN